MAVPRHLGRSSRLAWKSHLQASSKLSKAKAANMVLYIDDQIIALNKPPGIAVHDGPGIGCALTTSLKLWQYDNDTPPSLAHRIDKHTTGIVLLSRNTDSARKMAELFKEKRIVKKYCALCVGVPSKPQGSIEIPLGVKNISSGNKRSMHRVVLQSGTDSNKSSRGRQRMAITNYSVISENRIGSLIDVTPVTGLRHQIRVHLADGLMCPVIGDYKFAGPLFRMNESLAKKMSAIGRAEGYIRGPMYLHAYQVTIPLVPGKPPLVIRAPLPDYFIKTCRTLGFHTSKQYQKIVNLCK